MGKPPELTRGRPGPKYDVRPSAREYEPHKRINQKEDPSDFEHKQDPNHHSGHYTLEAFRHDTAHDVVSYLRDRQPQPSSQCRASQALRTLGWPSRLRLSLNCSPPGLGGIDVFNGSFMKTSTIATPIAISNLGLVPFNVHVLGGQVYATYAPAGLANQRGATPGRERWRFLIQMEICSRLSLAVPTSPLPHHGALLSPHPVSVSSAEIYWSAISALWLARLMPSTRQPECSRAQSRLM